MWCFNRFWSGVYGVMKRAVLEEWLIAIIPHLIGGLLPAFFTYLYKNQKPPILLPALLTSCLPWKAAENRK